MGRPRLQQGREPPLEAFFACSQSASFDFQQWGRAGLQPFSRNKLSFQWTHPLFHSHPTVSLKLNSTPGNFWPRPLERGVYTPRGVPKIARTESVASFLSFRVEPLGKVGNRRVLLPRIQSTQFGVGTGPEGPRGHEKVTTFLFSSKFFYVVLRFVMLKDHRVND